MLSSLAGKGEHPSLIQMRQATGATSRDTFNVMAQRVAFTNALNLADLQIHKLEREWRDDVIRRIEKLDPWENSTTIICICPSGQTTAAKHTVLLSACSSASVTTAISLSW